MSIHPTVDPAADAEGPWQCRRCGRRSGLGSTCLACAFQARLTTEAPAIVRHRDGAAAPEPVVAVQVLLLFGAVLAAVGAAHTLSGGLHLLLDLPQVARDGGLGLFLLLGTGAIGLLSYFTAHAALSLWAINALHHGQPLARLALSALPALDLLVLAMAGPGPVLGLTFAAHLIVAGLLWLPVSSQQHFAAGPAGGSA